MTSSISLPLFAIRHHKIGGVESAVYNLARGLSNIGVSLDLVTSNVKYLSPTFVSWVARRETAKIRQWQPHVLLARSRFFEETIFGAFGAEGRTVIYPNYFLPPRLKHAGAIRSVIIHDLQFKHIPQNFSAAKRAWLDASYRFALNNADAIFLISEYERAQIERYYGPLALKRCHVAYNAIDWVRFDDRTAVQAFDFMSSGRFILSVAYNYPHKNTMLLLKAFLSVAHRLSDTYLVLVGDPSYEIRRYVAEGVDRQIAQRIKFLGFVSDSELGLLYRSAALFVLPSSYEGFGMPAVEALGLGTPTLVANSAALPEVTCGFAEMMELTASINDWADKIVQMLRGAHPVTEAQATHIRSRYSAEKVGARVISALC